MIPLHLSPDGAVLLAALGLLLLLLELNRPGWILPGSLGLLLFLLSIPALLPGRHPSWALSLLLFALGLCALHLWYPLPILGTVLVATTLSLSLRYFTATPSGPSVHWPAAVAAGSFFGVLACRLARVARIARQAKRLHP